MKEQFLICACYSLDNLMHLWYDSTGKWPELYTTMHINTHNSFFKRVWVGIKYIFGYKSRYGCWDEFIFDKENEKKLYDFLKERHDLLHPQP